MAEHSLVVPFLTDDPLFAYGCEFGMLYSRMRDESITVIDDYVSRELQEQITLTCNRTGWRIVEMTPWNEHWFRMRMDRVSWNKEVQDGEVC